MVLNDLELDKAKFILENGGIVGIPTETVYGLAANAFDDKAITRIFEAKRRPFSDPLIVHCSSLAQVHDIVLDFPDILKKLAVNCWPGPLTILLNKKNTISDLVTSGQGKVAVRVPNHFLTLKLLENLSFPLVAPSANPFGYVSPTSADHVKAQLENRIDYVLDGGQCLVGLESTIISLNENSEIVIHRPGAIDEEKIFELTNKKAIFKSNIDHKLILPGTLDHHYAPKKKVVLGNIEENYKLHKEKRIGFLLFSHTMQENSNCVVRKMSVEKSLDEAAQNLFRFLRELDDSDAEIILAEKVPNIGIGVAINDRLVRASAKK